MMPLRAGRPGRASRTVRWSAPGPAVVLAGLAALAGCSRNTDNPQPRQGRQGQAVPVLVAVAASKDVPVQLRDVGTVEAYATVAVKSMIGGAIQQVHVQDGQQVKQDDLLFTIDPRPAQAALNQAQANLARDTAQAKNAALQAERTAQLFARNAATQDELDTTRAQAEAFSALVQADNAAIENAKLQLAYSYIRSPIDAVAGEVTVNQGNVVKANDVSMITLNQVKPIYVSFTVPQQHLRDIRESMARRPLEVEAFLANTSESLAKGILTFVDNTVDVTTGTIRLKARFENTDEHLWPGQFVNVVLTLFVQADAVTVPNQAIQMGQQGPFVFVVNPDMTVQPQPVTPGRTLNDDTVVEKGLQPGQTVVTDGQLRLVPGAKVQIKSELASRPATSLAEARRSSVTAPNSRPSGSAESRP
jgi:multidrug efflux system membrane fusion protein